MRDAYSWAAVNSSGEIFTGSFLEPIAGTFYVQLENLQRVYFRENSVVAENFNRKQRRLHCSIYAVMTLSKKMITSMFSVVFKGYGLPKPRLKDYKGDASLSTLTLQRNPINRGRSTLIGNNERPQRMFPRKLRWGSSLTDIGLPEACEL